jgi:hypothetical protein
MEKLPRKTGKIGLVLFAFFVLLLGSGRAAELKRSGLSGGGVKSSGGNYTLNSSLGGARMKVAKPSGAGLLAADPLRDAPSANRLLAAADLRGAHAYPVPYKPAAGHSGITFTALTGQVTIKIYTLSGELVKTLSKDDSSNSIAWNVANDKGEGVASGVYLYVMESSQSGKKIGKLMVIK